MSVSPLAVLGAADTEEDELARSIDDLVGSVCSLADARHRADGGPADRRVWRRVGRELGLIGLAVPEPLGGQGQSFAVHSSVVASLGRRLAPTPHLPVLGPALSLLTAGDGAISGETLQSVLAGDLVPVVAGFDGGWSGGFGEPGTELVETSDGVVVRGCTPPVVQAAEADLLLVVTDDGVALVDLHAEGVRVEPVETLDLTRPRALVHLRDAPVRMTRPGLAHLERALVETTALAAVESVAAARTCLVATVDYVTIRHQFDRPVGSFQAVQHTLADLFGELAAAEAAVDLAVRAVTNDPDCGPEVVAAVRTAKVAASEAFLSAARGMVHLHGGIGFTWEHSSHLFLRRALTDRSLLGDPALHRRALARAFVAAS